MLIDDITNDSEIEENKKYLLGTSNKYIKHHKLIIIYDLACFLPTIFDF